MASLVQMSNLIGRELFHCMYVWREEGIEVYEVWGETVFTHTRTIKNSRDAYVKKLNGIYYHNLKQVCVHSDGLAGGGGGLEEGPPHYIISKRRGVPHAILGA